MISYHHVDDLLGEFAYAVKSLCDHLLLPPDDLCKIKYAEMVESILSDRSLARHVKSIPFRMDIPEQMTPALAGDYVFSMEMSPAPSEDEYEKHAHGISEYRIRRDHNKPWSDPKNQLTFWQWSGFREHYPLGSWIYFVKKDDLRSFYRAVFALQNRITEDVDVPVLPGQMLCEIYANTIKFLQEGRKKREEYKKERIPYRRGLLLCGVPGCGKTMTCKWLRQLCMKKGFAYRIVTMEEYRNAMSHGTAQSLFRLPKGTAGIIFFDDMDIYVKDRNNGVAELQTFLTEMDGIRPTEGVVYVFTTNVVKELDAAFVRPGRIDLYLPFRVPTKKLRERFVNEKFSERTLSLIDIEHMIDKTHDYSFAEIEEIRKLITMDDLNGKKVSVDNTFKTFELHRKEFQQRSELGFGATSDSNGDDYYDDSELPGDLQELLKTINDD